MHPPRVGESLDALAREVQRSGSTAIAGVNHRVGMRRISFCLSFHLALLGPTGAHWLDGPPDVSCRDGIQPYAVDDPLLSCGQQLVAGWAAVGKVKLMQAQGRDSREVAGCATLAVFGAEHSPGGVDGGDPVDQDLGEDERW